MSNSKALNVLTPILIILGVGLLFFITHEVLHHLTSHHHHDHDDNEECHDHLHSNEIDDENHSLLSEKEINVIFPCSFFSLFTIFNCIIP